LHPSSVGVSRFKESAVVVVVGVCAILCAWDMMSPLISRGIANPSVQFLQHGRCFEAQRHAMSFGVPVLLLPILRNNKKKDEEVMTIRIGQSGVTSE
jgi:hypothetical protein